VIFLSYQKKKGSRFYGCSTERLHKVESYYDVLKELGVFPKEVKLCLADTSGLECITFCQGNTVYSVVKHP
jgi:hypothetical protein